MGDATAPGSSDRTAVSSAAPWESRVGYSRAVRAGRFVFVSGTTSFDASGKLVGAGDAYAQTRQALANVLSALARLGARAEHVVRTRLYVTDIERWEDVGRAHAEVFGAVRPATSMVQVGRLIDPLMLVEVEADAVLPT
jgi:enamine deaminase RidA (YjgF/YER057c/UK114 family)